MHPPITIRSRWSGTIITITCAYSNTRIARLAIALQLRTSPNTITASYD